MAETPVCEVCGESPQEIHLKDAGLCGDCFSSFMGELCGDHFIKKPCFEPLFKDGQLVAVCLKPHGEEHTHGSVTE